MKELEGYLEKEKGIVDLTGYKCKLEDRRFNTAYTGQPKCYNTEISGY